MSRSVRQLAFGGRLLTAAAACVALYLASMALSRTSLPGCEGASSCQSLLNTRWAYVFGMPVSFAGFVCYSLLLLLSGVFLQRQRTMTGLLAVAVALVIPAAALWFTGVQAFVLKEFCLWCGLTHGLGMTGAALLWLGRKLNPPAETAAPERLPAFPFFAAAAAAAGTGVLVAGSLLTSAPLPAPAVVTTMPAATAALVQNNPASNGKLDPDDFPVIGRADAAAVNFLLSDFTCPHCLELHAAIHALAQRNGCRFRVAVLPAASTPDAAAIQTTMLTLWHADPDKWHAAAAMISSGQIKATPEIVKKTAIKLAGEEKFAAASYQSAPLIGAQLKTAATLLASYRDATGQTLLPKLIHGDKVLNGAETNPSRLADFLTGGEESAPLLAKNARDPRRAEIAGPKLAAISPEMDLKGISPGRPLDVQIKVQNRGNSPLQLGWLETDTGCFVTSMPESSIPPGRVAAIGLRVHAPEKTGAASRRSIRIHSNSPGKPCEVILTSTLQPAATAPAPAPASPVSPSPGSARIGSVSVSANGKRNTETGIQP